MPTHTHPTIEKKYLPVPNTYLSLLTIVNLISSESPPFVSCTFRICLIRPQICSSLPAPRTFRCWQPTPYAFPSQPDFQKETSMQMVSTSPLPTFSSTHHSLDFILVTLTHYLFQAKSARIHGVIHFNPFLFSGMLFTLINVSEIFG